MIDYTAAEPVASIIGDRVRLCREMRGWSQSELGRITGIHHAHISRFESGQRRPSIGCLITLAAAFQVKPSWLIDGIEVAS